MVEPQTLDSQVLLTLEGESDFTHESAASKAAGDAAGWLPISMEEEADMTPTDMFFRLHISRCGACCKSLLAWLELDLGDSG
jgi:hypothetical protein